MKMFYTPRRPSAQRRRSDPRWSGSPDRPAPDLEDNRGEKSVIPKTACSGCNGLFCAIDGPKHPYLTASAGCWARFGQSLALHYSDQRYWPAHQLLTDAYALQHSEGDDRRAIRSTHVHLAALFAQVCLEQPEARVVSLRRALSGFDYHKLPGAWPTPSASIADVDVSEPERHLATVATFARTVMTDWSEFQDLAEKLCKV
ncbi:MAG: DUF5946 family protein [Pseudomonadota bacterium]